MMLVRIRVAPSAIHGLGVFAVDAVAQGAPIWRFEPGFDREFTAKQFSALPSEAQAHLRWFAYLDKTTAGWVLSGDHSCFMNHSPEPNTGASSSVSLPVTTHALRDIAAGEELTCDYVAFDAEAKAKLGATSTR